MRFLREQHLIVKDHDIDKLFEAATDYLFQFYLNHQPLNLPGSEQPDGALSIGDELLLWDNKSKETPVNVKDHFPQFDRYFNKAESKAAALIVVGPSFTPNSDNDARIHKANTGNAIALITAEELKQIAIDWSSSKKSKDVFPLKYFYRCRTV